jgi:DHA3 family macrolide efflux protein-like MFS transporter
MEPNPTEESFKHYLSFWTGQLFSLLGSNIVQFSIIVWITIETGSQIALAIATFFALIPQLITLPFAGVLVDRLNRKAVLFISDTFQAFATFSIILLFIFGQEAYWPIILINSLRGFFQAFHFPTVKAIMPLMVPKAQLSRMNALSYLFNGLIQIIGPTVGGFLLAIFKIQEILWADIITYLIAIIPLILIRIPSIKGKTKEKSFKKDFKIGFEVIKKTHGFLTLILIITFLNFLHVPFRTLLPYYIMIDHNRSEFILGIVSGIISGGVVAGALVVTVKKTWKHKVYIILGGLVISNLGYLMTSLAPQGVYLIVAIGGFISSAMMPIINTMLLTIMQTAMPPDKQGRVTSIVLLLSMAVTPLGSIMAGPFGELLGTRYLYMVCALLSLLSLALLWIFSDVKHVKYRQAEQEEEKEIPQKGESTPEVIGM